MFIKNDAHKRAAAAAEMAGARSNVYDLMIQMFNRLPDEDLLEKIKTGVFEEMFNRFDGVAYLKSYRSKTQTLPPETILNELAVDRTRILRGTGPKDLKPPYEGCYKLDGDLGSAAANVKCFYRAAGLLPDERVPESPDYLCVQLDFMKHLCLQEQKRWSSGPDPAETIAHEKAFLNDHLGSWVGNFCHRVRTHAATDFYRGVAMILKGYIDLEIDYLQKFPM